MPRLFLSLAVLFPILFSSAFAERAFPGLVYAKAGGRELALDLFVPEDVGSPPLVVYIHGGAWMQGTRKRIPFKWLVEQGFALASISYRFSQDATYPAQIEDCKAAVRWLRENASKYGCDARRIGVIGESAGGHLAVLLGTTAGNPKLEGRPANQESSAVQAVVDFYGPSDFILRSRTQPEFTNEPGSRVYGLLGGAPGDNPELAKLASGAWQVSPGDAPMLIFHGADDAVVLPGQSRRLLAAAEEAGVEATLHVVPGAAHRIEPFLTPENKRLVTDFLRKNLQAGE